MPKIIASTKGGSGGATITVQDEGITQSAVVTTLNFVGAGVVSSGAGAVETITIAGGAGASWTETEIDFGSGAPVTGGDFTITDAGSTTGSKIIVVPSGKPATGRVGNDYAWDAINFSALPGAGNFVLSAICAKGPLNGLKICLETVSRKLNPVCQPGTKIIHELHSVLRITPTNQPRDNQF